MSTQEARQFRHGRHHAVGAGSLQGRCVVVAPEDADRHGAGPLGGTDVERGVSHHDRIARGDAEAAARLQDWGGVGLEWSPVVVAYNGVEEVGDAEVHEENLGFLLPFAGDDAQRHPLSAQGAQHRLQPCKETHRDPARLVVGDAVALRHRLHHGGVAALLGQDVAQRVADEGVQFRLGEGGHAALGEDGVHGLPDGGLGVEEGAIEVEEDGAGRGRRGGHRPSRNPAFKRRRRGVVVSPSAPGTRAQVLDGKALAARMEGALAAEVAALKSRFGKAPGLTVVLVGDDPASAIYVKRKVEACSRVGIASREVRLPATASEDELVGLVEKLNRDADVNGILVQVPLPSHVSKARVLHAIQPYKDVDAFHPESVGHALIGDETLAPCTPQGVLLLLDEAGVKLAGAEVVVINHSNLIGKPLAALLINRDATVTVCHKQTKNLKEHTRRADVVVTATGVPGLLTADHIRAGAVVVDVGIHRTAAGKVVGDCHDSVWTKAAWVTPVPGGVGPMTIAVLLQNTVRSFKRKMGVLPAPLA